MAKTVQKTTPTKAKPSRYPVSNTPLTKPAMLWAAVAASAIGLYFAFNALFKTMGVENMLTRSIGCTINDWITCDPVYASDGAYMLGIPVAAWGLAFYVATLLLALYSALTKGEGSASAAVVGLGLSVFAVLFSAFKAFQLVQMGYLCPFCVAMYAANIALLILFMLALVREEGVGLVAYLQGFIASLGSQAPSFSYQPKIIFPLLLALAAYGFTYIGTRTSLRKQETNATTSEAQVLKVVETHFNQEPQKIPVAPDTPVKGNPDAKVTIIEFADYQCPGCKVAAGLVKEAMKEYGNYVKVYFQNYPLDNTINDNLQRQLHQHAGLAAKATTCAAKSNKFWEMHDALFNGQELISPQMIRGEAQQLGLDMGAFDSCIADPATTARVKEDIQRGKEVGVNSTPSLYINGRLLDKWNSIETLKRVIQEELKRANVKKNG